MKPVADHNPSKAESMLHEAIEKDYNVGGKDYYYPLRDEKSRFYVVVFKPTHNDGSEYHGYTYLTEKIDDNTKAIAKKFKDEGIINNTEYQKIVNNKCPHWKPGLTPRFKL